MFAPTVNSYKRYQPESWAPTAIAWSVDNRTCGFRVVGHGASFRLESRIPGGDVNPYLAYAATIAAGLHGIEHAIEPSPRFDGNAYAAAELTRVPSSLAEAAEAFAASKVRGRSVRRRRARPSAQHRAPGARRLQPRGDRLGATPELRPTGGRPPPAGRHHRPPPGPHGEVATVVRDRVAARLPRRGDAHGRDTRVDRPRRRPHRHPRAPRRARAHRRTRSRPRHLRAVTAPQDLRRRSRHRRVRARGSRTRRWRASCRRSRSAGASRCSTWRSAARSSSTSRTILAWRRTAGPASRTAAARRRSPSRRERCCAR